MPLRFLRLSSSAAPRTASALKIFLVGLIGSLLVRALSRTLRWEYLGLDGEERLWTQGQPRILSFWHGQQLLMSRVYLRAHSAKSRPMKVLISEHSDGRMIAKVMQFLGIDSIAGSSSRGGRKALFDLIEALRSGSHISITPDGPKGPAFKMKQGVVRIAQRSGALIHPVAIAAERKWVFGSWDKMFLPKPFSRVVLWMGEGIKVPAELDDVQCAALTEEIERHMNDLTLQAEERVLRRAM